MRQKSGPEKQPAEDAIRDIRRATRRHFSAEEKIRVVLEGLRRPARGGEHRRTPSARGIVSSMYYGWSKSSWRPVKGGLLATRRAPRPPTR